MKEEKEEKRTIHNFLTVNDLDIFNDKIKPITHTPPTERKTAEIETPLEQDSGEEKVGTGVYEEEKYESFTVNPEEISDDILSQLSDIIDKKSTYSHDDFETTDLGGPPVRDRLREALSVIYITENGLPVGVCALTDPTKVSYNGVIPGDFIELKTGISIENRVCIEFFQIIPEKQVQGLDRELIRRATELSPKLYFVCPFPDDKYMHYNLERNGFKMASSFNTEWGDEPLELWLN